jgi:transcriptional regulator with XRE-family HTH domain
MTNSRDIIIKLKEVREERGLSLSDILDMLEKNGDYVSKTTLSRIFAKDSENVKFRYEDTIRPIANALLGLDFMDETDTPDINALKTIIRLKNEKIKELQAQLDHVQVKFDAKIEKERAQSRRSIDFLRHQIELKDKRIDILMDAAIEKNKVTE